MRRAVNFLRESKKQQEMLQGLDGKKNSEGHAWDRHTNKPRWNHTATDLVVVQHEAAGGVGGHESAGSHQSAGGVRGFGAASGGKAARIKMMLHDRHMQAEHRKRYDLWGVQGFLKEDREGFLEQAALVSKEKTSGSIDDQFRDAIFLKVMRSFSVTSDVACLLQHTSHVASPSGRRRGILVPCLSPLTQRLLLSSPQHSDVLPCLRHAHCLALCVCLCVATV
jgi:hypothetical protein